MADRRDHFPSSPSWGGNSCVVCRIERLATALLAPGARHLDLGRPFFFLRRRSVRREGRGKAWSLAANRMKPASVFTRTSLGYKVWQRDAPWHSYILQFDRDENKCSRSNPAVSERRDQIAAESDAGTACAVRAVHVIPGAWKPMLCESPAVTSHTIRATPLVARPSCAVIVDACLISCRIF